MEGERWPRLPHQAAMLEHVHALEALAAEHDYDARIRDVLRRLCELILVDDGPARDGAREEPLG